jgi:hypothetical protein
MKTFNVGLIGYGKMGKIYAKEIKKKKEFKIVDILEHKNILKNPKVIKKFFKSKKINLFIISSPISTHFKYLQHAYKEKKDIIIEKPLVENNNQLKKLKLLNKDYKKKVMIHHNDLLNFENMNFIDNLSDCKKIEMFYGKKELVNSYEEPFFDWLPHPLSIIINLIGVPIKFKILKYTKKVTNNLVLEELKLIFNFSNFQIFLNFSNDLKSPSKKIILHKNNKNKIYDGYAKKNQKTIKLLLNKFYKVNKINDINTNLKVYELLFKIKKQLQKKIN